MKKLSYLIILALVLGLVLTGCSLLSNIGQAPATGQSGITYLTKGLPSGLVGLWHFSEIEEGTDITNDSSGNNNHGTVYDASLVDGQSGFGKALSFDGVNDYVDCGIVPQLDGVSEFTVEFWIKVDSLPFPAIPWQGIIARGNTNQRTPWVFGNRGKSNLYMQFETTLGGYSDCSFVTNDLTEGQWNHVAFTWDGYTVTSYIDGVAGPTDTTAGSVLADTDGSLKFGYIPGYAYFNGTIDEVRIWDVALPEEQLGQVYNFGGILPPIKADGSSVFNLGRTIPVKFQLWDDQGNFVTDAVANIFVKKLYDGTSGEVAAVSTAAATTGNLFRYDSSSNQYIFNLSTKLPLNDGESWSTGTWEIRIELDDCMSYYVDIGLR